MDKEDIKYTEQLIYISGRFEEKTPIKAFIGENTGLAYHRPFDLTGKIRGFVVTHVESGRVISPALHYTEAGVEILDNVTQAKYCISELTKIADWTKNPVAKSLDFQRVRGIFSEAKGI